MHILFVDPIPIAKPYDNDRLLMSAMGGTEATVVRIASKLSETHRISVAQYRRQHDKCESSTLSFISFKTMERMPPESVDRVVILRRFRTVPKLAKRFPSARIYLWVHDFPLKTRTRKRKQTFQSIMLNADCTLIAVSGHQRDVYKSFLSDPRIKTVIMYNPVAETLRPNDQPITPNQLIFYSSPHKGLNQVLTLFQAAKERLPDLSLLIANPGYFRIRADSKAGLWLRKCLHRFIWDGDPSVAEHYLNQPGVKVVGRLSHQQIIQEVRRSVCVFYPQSTFPETVGLVYAEANAVGEPRCSPMILAQPAKYWVKNRTN